MQEFEGCNRFRPGMNVIQNEPEELAPSAELAPSPPLLRTLVACDLVESTALTQQLGDRSIADFMHQLDRQARDLLQRYGGTEIDKTDGFLLMFERPIPAVAFALEFQRMLHNLSLTEFLPLKARIGIHVGDVVLWRNSTSDVARGAKPVEVEGLVKPVAARLMNLALPGQILMSGVARALALRAQDELTTEFPPEWRMHGRYMFKGVAEPVPVFEVGEGGIAPLRSPAYSSKAFREVPWWRRPALLVLEAVVLLAAIAVPAWVFLRSPPVIAFAERDWVVVGSLKNLTDEHRFDEAVDSAFRLGLEQSRFVNVLSDLKVRDSVSRMQRDPDSTSVDRAIGSEVALRDGARALILPTVAEAGHKVRISAEVIDPNTQTTIYTESAEGVGVDSVLASVDQINERLRAHLGEALASVTKDSLPLEKVATKNLDALRAYSLGQRAYNDGRYAQSIEFYRQALQLDSGFAIARAHLARSYLMVDRREEALKELDTAMTQRARLGPRDALYVEAWRLTMGGPPRQAVDKLELLAKLYPDFFTAQSLFAYFAFDYANRFDDSVIAAAQQANSPRNAHPMPTQMLLGMLLLCNEKYDRAIEMFVGLEQQTGTKHYATALPYAAKREFDKADAALENSAHSDSPSADLGRFIPRIALAVDRGQNDKAFGLLAAAERLAAEQDPREALRYFGIRLALYSLLDSQRLKAEDIAEYARRANAALERNELSYRADQQFQVLLAAYLAARHGDKPLAEKLLRGVNAEITGEDFPVPADMLAIARAELQLANDDADAAIASLRQGANGRELYLNHAASFEAYTRKGDSAAARDEARWLATHRGRAYAETNMNSMLMPLNAGWSEIAQRTLDRAAKN